MNQMSNPSPPALGTLFLFLFGMSAGCSAERPPFATVTRSSPVKLEWLIEWKPPTEIHQIKIAPMNWSTNDVIRWAKYFGLTNVCQPMPGNLAPAPGWWIRDFTDSSGLRWKVTYWSQRENNLLYSTGDDGYRWDLKRHEPLFRGVPTRDEAVALAEPLVKELGIDVPWARRASGQLLTSQRVHGTGFFRRGSTNYEEVVQQQGVYLYQKVGDGTLLGDEQGSVLVRYVSEHKLSDVEARIVREIETIPRSAVSKAELIEAVRTGKAWGFPNANLGPTVDVIGADIIYPVNRRWKNEVLRPFYRLHVRKPGESERDFLFVESTR